MAQSKHDPGQSDLLLDTTPARGKTQYSLPELMNLKFPPPKLVVPGLIPVGLTNLSGRPKVGKSFLVLQIAGAKATGGELFGNMVGPGKVLCYFLEDSRQRIQERARTQGFPVCENFVIDFHLPSLAREGTDVLENEIIQGGYELIVIDTFSRAAPTADQNDLPQMNVILGRLQQMALKYDVGILIVDHHKKPTPNGEDPIDDILGSTGKAALADTVMGLYREKGKRDAAILRIVSREYEPIDMNLRFDSETSRWELDTFDRDLSLKSASGKILSMCQTLTHESIMITGTVLAARLGSDAGNVNKCLNKLVEKGVIVRLQKQGVEVPYQLVEPPNTTREQN